MENTILSSSEKLQLLSKEDLFTFQGGLSPTQYMKNNFFGAVHEVVCLFGGVIDGITGGDRYANHCGS